MNLKKIKNAFR